MGIRERPGGGWVDKDGGKLELLREYMEGRVEPGRRGGPLPIIPQVKE